MTSTKQANQYQNHNQNHTKQTIFTENNKTDNNSQKNQNISSNNNNNQITQNNNNINKNTNQKSIMQTIFSKLFSQKQETQNPIFFQSRYPEPEKLAFLSQEKSGNNLEKILKKEQENQLQEYEKVKAEKTYCFDHEFHSNYYQTLKLQKSISLKKNSSNNNLNYSQNIIQEQEQEQENEYENEDDKIINNNNININNIKKTIFLNDNENSNNNISDQDSNSNNMNHSEVLKKYHSENGEKLKKSRVTFKQKKCLKPRKNYLEGKTQEQLEEIKKEEEEGKLLSLKLQKEKKEKEIRELEKQKEDKKLKCNKCKELLPADLKVLKLDDMICQKCKDQEKEKKLQQQNQQKKTGPQRKCRECGKMYALTQENRRFFTCEPCRKPPSSESESSSSNDIDNKKENSNSNNINITVSTPNNNNIQQQVCLGNSQLINLNNKSSLQNSFDGQQYKNLLDSKIISDKKKEKLNDIKDQDQLQATMSEKLFIEMPDDHDKTVDNGYLFISLYDYYVYIQQHLLSKEQQCSKDKLKEFGGSVLKKYAYNFHDQEKDLESNRSRSNTPTRIQQQQHQQQQIQDDQNKKNKKIIKQVSFNKEIEVHIMQYYITVQQGDGNVVNLEDKLISSNMISNYYLNNWALLDL